MFRVLGIYNFDYTLNTYKMSNQCHTMYNVSRKVMSLEELQGHRRRCCRRRRPVRPPYQCGVPPLPPAPRSILQNKGKTEVLPVLPTTVPLSCIECIVGFLIVVISFSYQTKKQNCVTEWKNETLQKRYAFGL